MRSRLLMMVTSGRRNLTVSGVPANGSGSKDGNTPFTVSSDVPTLAGYKFNGWNTLANGGGTPYAAGATIPGASITGTSPYMRNGFNNFQLRLMQTAQVLLGCLQLLQLITTRQHLFLLLLLLGLTSPLRDGIPQPMARVLPDTAGRSILT